MLRPLWVTLIVRDNKGRVIKKRRFHSRSYVIAMTDILAVQIQQVGVGLAITDTSGVSRAIAMAAISFASLAAAGDATKGTVVGTGINAVAITDIALQTLITHGTGAGQLQYGIQTFQNPITAGATRKFSMTRTFINGSGSSITVQEAGLYALAGSGTTWSFCIARDRIAGGQAVLAGETLTVQYDIGVTV